MFPTTDTLLGFGPAIDTHSAFVMLGLAVAGLLYWWELRRRRVSEPSRRAAAMRIVVDMQ